MSAVDIKRMVSALFIGTLFGVGLIVSEMVNPAKVHNFLDIAGTWDASLLFVMIGAVSVTFIGYKLVLSRHTPILEDLFRVPGNTQVDRKLITGAIVFGIGWGLSGLCPSPGLVGLGLGIPELFVFVVSLIVGINIYRIAVNWGRDRLPVQKQ